MSVWDEPFSRRDAVSVIAMVVVLGFVAVGVIVRHNQDGQIDRIREHGDIEVRIIRECHRGP